MHIHRIITKDVPGVPDMDMVLWNDWLEQPLTSVLFTGVNGSGKTRLLRLIVLLWGGLADTLSSRFTLISDNYVLSRLARSVYRTECFMSIEIRGFLGRTLVLYLCPNDCVHGDLLNQYPPGTLFLNINGRTVAKSVDITRRVQESEIAESDLSEELRSVGNILERIYLGATTPITELPNFVYIDPDYRQLLYDENRNRQIRIGTPQPELWYDWLATYNPDAQGRSIIPRRRSETGSSSISLEQMLGNLKLRDPERFQQTIEAINTFFIDKRIDDYSDRVELLVETKWGTHSLYELSSGERQALLLMFMVSRWMMPGGIVIIDEPDLHLHISLQRQFIHAIENLVESRGGQLLIASHSKEMASEFSDRQRFDLTERVAR